MTAWFLIGWPILLAFGCVAWSCRQPADADTRAQEDAEQAAYLSAWMKRRNAIARGDTRGQKEATDLVQRALHAKLRAEMRR